MAVSSKKSIGKNKKRNKKSIVKMKIGILTFHCAHNYGAVLQCYALQQYLLSLGHEVVVINYRPEYLLDPYTVFPKLSIYSWKGKLTRLINFVITFYIRIVRHRVFEDFINKYLKLSDVVRTKHDIEKLDYDVFIMGSDQIWNPKITKGFDDVYFGYFDTKRGAKKIAYAASLGLSSLTEEQKSYLQNSMSNFDAIGVRENNMKDLLQPLTAKSVVQVLDPTLLLDRKIWESLSSKSSLSKEKYVLTYQVEVNKNVNRIAYLIAKQLDAKVIQLVAWPKFNYANEDIRQVAGPLEYISYIKYAECVVTSSFHGTAFSIIFRRPFYVVDLQSLRKGSNERMKTLLSEFHLEERYISENGNPVYHNINYSTVEDIIKYRKNSSRDFLINGAICLK